jgi:hypothetical protein
MYMQYVKLIIIDEAYVHQAEVQTGSSSKSVSDITKASGSKDYGPLQAEPLELPGLSSSCHSRQIMSMDKQQSSMQT